MITSFRDVELERFYLKGKGSRSISATIENPLFRKLDMLNAVK